METIKRIKIISKLKTFDLGLVYIQNISMPCPENWPSSRPLIFYFFSLVHLCNMFLQDLETGSFLVEYKMKSKNKSSSLAKISPRILKLVSLSDKVTIPWQDFDTRYSN